MYPLTIFVLYSPSRRQQFDQFNRFLQKCDNYNKCQKILIADSTTDVYPDGYETIIVPRQYTHFCWSDAWATAINASRSDKLLYLDCDRILPTFYLTQLIDTLADNEFVYPLYLWNFKRDLPDDTLADRQKLATLTDVFKIERLAADYLCLPCRGPLSGTSAFTKQSYERVGPLDNSYISWGYPDLEYQEMIKAKGLIFRPIKTEVLHLHHKYEINTKLFLIINAWNGVRFFRKWKLPMTTRFINSLRSLNLDSAHLLQLSLDELISQHSDKK